MNRVLEISDVCASFSCDFEHSWVATKPPESEMPISTKELVVSLTVEPRVGVDKRAIVVGKTNLPTGTNLIVSVEDAVSPDGEYQTKTSVSREGTYQTQALGPNSGLPDGWYVASVTMLGAMAQPRMCVRSLATTVTIWQVHWWREMRQSVQPLLLNPNSWLADKTAWRSKKPD